MGGTRRAQARAEVERLEGCRADAMRAMVALKRRDLEQLCASARMLPPPADAPAAELLSGAAASAQVWPALRVTPVSLSEQASVPRESGAPCGPLLDPAGAWLLRQVAQQLARVVSQITDAQAEAARRSTLLAAVAELEGARAECAWLEAYNRDDGRYKARRPPARPQCAMPASAAG